MLQRLVLGLISFYRKGISPMTPPSCRFAPTCSVYAEQAVRQYGVAKGSWLALRRLLRCHPFGGKGYDPVPSVVGQADGSTPPPVGAPDNAAPHQPDRSAPLRAISTSAGR